MTSSSSHAALVVNGIFSVGFLVLAIILTIYHLATTYVSTKHLCNNKFLRKHPSMILSYLLVFVACISGISLTMDSVIISHLCSAAQYYGPSLYSIFKTIVYLILCVRIYITFKDSMYAYNVPRLIAWSVLLTVWTLFNVIAGNLTVESHIEKEERNTKCLVTPSFVYIVSQALLDVTSGVVNCILFVRPICKLYKLAGDNIKIKKIAYKQCILSLIAIISSIISMAGVGAFSNIVPVFVASDMLVSTLCIVLMYRWNSRITETICVCCMPKEDIVHMENEINAANGSQTDGNSNVNKYNVHNVGLSKTLPSKTTTAVPVPVPQPIDESKTVPQPTDDNVPVVTVTTV